MEGWGKNGAQITRIRLIFADIENFLRIKTLINLMG